ncbi:MAG TPA: helix-turn-helix domain-containing protein [Burkholderiaceae bacterium]|nr:helix-turn-helix domain-containing protein [Burkholderiaceae bacterium]
MKRIALPADRCPCCGGPLPGVALAWIAADNLLIGCGRHMRLSPRAGAVFDVLWRARHRPSGVAMPELCEKVFGGDDGPSSEYRLINQYIHRLRRALPAFGLGIVTVGWSGTQYRGAWATYRLTALQERQAA